ncbi:MAG: hypothetical protein P4L53_22265 [Candidatus Obscuribacterales bacterium]|nr:hypothetical protein [Candidatus Obscuribacterales bacterium]
MQQELRQTAELELDRNEKILWLAQPDANILVKKVLAAWILLLTALFLESISLIQHAQGDQSELLMTRVVAMALFAFVGAGMVMFVPTMSQSTIFAITDKRVLKLIVNSFGHKILFRSQSSSNAREATMKSVVHQKDSTEKTFWFNFGAYMFSFLMWATLFLPTMITNFDAYIAAATLIIVGVLTAYAIMGKHKAAPTHRHASGTLYSIGQELMYVEAIPLKEISSIQSGSNRSGAADLFIFSEKRGCLRLAAACDAATAVNLLEKRNQADFGNAASGSKETKRVGTATVSKLDAIEGID